MAERTISLLNQPGGTLTCRRGHPSMAQTTLTVSFRGGSSQSCVFSTKGLRELKAVGGHVVGDGAQADRRRAHGGTRQVIHLLFERGTANFAMLDASDFDNAVGMANL